MTERRSSSAPALVALSPRFEVLRRIGEGGMGVVYEAVDRDLGDRVALKTLRDPDAAAVVRLKREFRTLARIHHPSLVTLHELFAGPDGAYFTMELVHGRPFFAAFDDAKGGSTATWSDPSPLATSVVAPSDAAPVSGVAPARTWRPVAIEPLRAALAELAAGVHALHEAGVLHCDLKPSNVLVGELGKVTILDFGLASDERSIAPLAHDSGVIVGTPGYMSPEQALGLPLGPPSDWYSVGLMLWGALAGRAPFGGTVLETLYARTRADGPPLPPEVDAPAELRALASELLRRDPAARPTGPEVLARLAGREAPRPPRATEPPGLVGRDGPLAALRRARDASRVGARLVFLHGPSGIGKTTLVKKLLGEAAASGAAALDGGCLERESLPYKALDRAVDALAPLVGEIDLAAAALPEGGAASLARLFPALAPLAPGSLSGAKASGEDAIALRRRGSTALRALVAHVAATRGAVLAIDDAQWGDVDSVALVRELLAEPPPPGLLVLVAFRTEEGEASAFVRGLRALGVADEIALDPLAPSDAEALAGRLVGEPARARRVAEESRGNPFFLRELAKHCAEQGEDPTRAVTLDEVLLARVARLPEGARRLLELVAVAAAPRAQGVLLDAAGLGPADATLLVQLRGESLVRMRGAARGDAVEAYHDRVREVVRASLAPDAARARHRALAEALARDAAADPEVLYTHFAAAGDAERAAAHAERAAERAARALAFDHAATLYRAALSARAEPAARRLLLERLGDALANAGRGKEAAAALLEAADASRGDEALALRRAAGQQLLLSGHVDEGKDVLRDVLRAHGMDLPSSPARAIASLLWHKARIALRGAPAPRADGVDRAALARADLCKSIAEGLMPVDPVRGADFLARFLLAAMDAGEPDRLALAALQSAANEAIVGAKEAERAARKIDAACALGATDPRVPVLAGVARGCVAHGSGRFREALVHFDEARRRYAETCTGAAVELNVARLFSGWDLYFLGRLDEMSGRARDQMKDAVARGDLYTRTVIDMGLVMGDLVQDDPAGARQRLDAALSRWRMREYNLQEHAAITTRMTIELYAGDVAAATRVLEEKGPLLRRSLLLRIELLRAMAEYIGAMVRLSAAARAPRGERAPLLRAAHRGARALAGERLVPARALSSLVHGVAEALGGDEAGARASLGRAVDEFDRSEMALLAAIARMRLGELTAGEAGRALVAEGSEALRARGVVSPARWARSLAAPVVDGDPRA